MIMVTDGDQYRTPDKNEVLKIIKAPPMNVGRAVLFWLVYPSVSPFCEHSN